MSKKSEEQDLALVQEQDLSLIEENILNKKQLQLILKRTPEKYVKKRPAKGGGQWDYVTGGYVRKCLNLMFGWDWDFEILDQNIFHGEVVVKGRLTCRSAEKTIVKTQFGNKEIVYKKGTEKPLSIGNDMKSAATDCLKKCASEIGIASDIYNKEDFREVFIDSSDDVLVKRDRIIELLEEKQYLISDEEMEIIDSVIKDEKEREYDRVLKRLENLKTKL